ncbi:hypothetical protein L1987_51681 [Smallanthus sonchifolius]|uniref:Uncharacterized protein n=1 Tax=Smallanthus sonchifolius TaxID=185202 RepID=A0ACB9EQZ2_9ASTR|nr:hypothetical protein L1987_51681 [Smallanthus sonchifolius]
MLKSQKDFLDFIRLSYLVSATTTGGDDNDGDGGNESDGGCSSSNEGSKDKHSLKGMEVQVDKVPKLEFYHWTWKNMGMRCKLFCDIDHILLLHQGPIHEFTLRLCTDCDCFELDHILLHLSKNHTVKKLTFDGWNVYYRYDLPISVFSLHHLTDLYLEHVDLDHQPIFNGFGSLRSLVLYHVGISTETLLHLLSNCPSLKSFSLDKWLVLDSVPQELQASLFHLKYFCFEEMCFDDNSGLGFLLGLIKCSPNLEKIMLQSSCIATSFSVGLLTSFGCWLPHNRFTLAATVDETPFPLLVLLGLPLRTNRKVILSVDGDEICSQDLLMEMKNEVPTYSTNLHSPRFNRAPTQH